jgi:hypothetical protein
MILKTMKKSRITRIATTNPGKIVVIYSYACIDLL